MFFEVHVWIALADLRRPSALNFVYTRTQPRLAGWEGDVMAAGGVDEPRTVGLGRLLVSGSGGGHGTI